MLTLVLLALMASPFWEAKQPADWTDAELQQMLSDSPWARTEGTGIYLASAKPMREAEEQLRLRSEAAETPEAMEDDYGDFLKANDGKYIVVAVHLPDPGALTKASEVRRMEKDSVLKVGKKKYRMIGHFPPTPSDPVLRLIFPRAVKESDKSFSLELYLPSVHWPYRFTEFFLDRMRYRGKLEY